MTPFEKLLERAFTTYDRISGNLSQRWREHANRRTVITLLLAGSLTMFLYISVIRPPNEFPLNTLITIEEGSTVTEAAIVLENNRAVRSATALRLLITLLGQEKEMHAGDYLFKEPRDLFSVARAIIIGAYGLEPMRIRIPEGATTKEMSRILGARLLRFSSDKFLSEALPNEGFLFPDTYYFLPNATEELVIRTMRQNFDARVSVIASEVQSFEKTQRDVVIMASLLEREARTTVDRRMIAGVLWNRLKKGMLLQVDAAFLYTLGKGSYQLTTEDLRSDSPYNTYRNPGLPPGPIGSPSLDSILAAVTPIKHDYLYYLADRSGVTHYSKTYAEHLRNKRKYID